MRGIAYVVIAALLASACEISRPLVDGGVDDATVDESALDPPPCVGSSDCVTCLSSASCGWCGASAQCVVGTIDGPSAGGCPNASWQWLPTACPGANDAGDPGHGTMCADVKSCGACADLVGCGYCANTSQCLTGELSGPTNGACAGADWIVSTSMCR